MKAFIIGVLLTIACFEIRDVMRAFDRMSKRQDRIEQFLLESLK